MVNIVASLTCIERWDPISKQPMFKSGAVRIEKIPVEENGTVKIHAKEQQQPAIQKVEKQKPNAMDVTDDIKRERALEYWMGTTFESMDEMLPLLERLEEQMKHDNEIWGGLKIVHRLAENMKDRMQPFVQKYGENKVYGRSVVDKLIDMLPQQTGSDPYHDLKALQGLFMYFCHLESHLMALAPTSQALWDRDFVDAVNFCAEQVQRQKAWVIQQIGVKSPQTLLVPQRPINKEQKS